MAREFVSTFYEIADEIAEKTAAGVTRDTLVSTFNNWAFQQCCSNELRRRDPQHYTIHPGLWLPITRLVVMAMIRQHEFDSGNVRTIEEILADWGEEPWASQAKSEATAKIKAE